MTQLVSRLSFYLIVFFCVSVPLAGQVKITKEVKELDKAIESGFGALKGKKWEIALGEFSKARKLLEKESISPYLFERLVLPDEDRSTRDQQEQQINLWRHSMGNTQAIRGFQTYTAALAGRRSQADAFSEEVYGLQSPVWGLSWRTFNPVIFDLFDKHITPEQTEGYGTYLYFAGDLLISSGDTRGYELIERSQAYLPKDPEVAATLAGIYIMSDRTTDAKKQAELSLSLKPGQASVYIDLANAEWILGNFSSAKKHALEARKLRPDLPGPNATLAFVAIEEGDLKVAKEFAESGSRLSKKHNFYQTVLAAYEVGAGNTEKARAIMEEAWGSDQPTPDLLKKWFFRGKALENILSLRK